MTVMIRKKSALINQLECLSKEREDLCERLPGNTHGEDTNNRAAEMPTKSAMTVSSGTVATIAHIFGAATKRRVQGPWCEARPALRKTSLWQSAAIADPDRPATIIAVIRPAQW